MTATIASLYQSIYSTYLFFSNFLELTILSAGNVYFLVLTRLIGDILYNIFCWLFLSCCTPEHFLLTLSVLDLLTLTTDTVYVSSYNSYRWHFLYIFFVNSLLLTLCLSLQRLLLTLSICLFLQHLMIDTFYMSPLAILTADMFYLCFFYIHCWHFICLFLPHLLLTLSLSLSYKSYHWCFSPGGPTTLTGNTFNLLELDSFSLISWISQFLRPHITWYWQLAEYFIIDTVLVYKMSYEYSIRMLNGFPDMGF